jgi:hypothetical protein
MASARELLEQADALMRRNRSPLMDDIPVLTDSVPVTPAGRPAARLRPPSPSVPETIPTLTERVDDTPVPAAVPTSSPGPIPPAVAEEGEPSDWLQLGGAEPSVIGEAPDSIAMVPPYEETAIEVEAPPDVEESFDAELEERARETAPPLEPVLHAPARISDVEPLPPPELLPEWESDTIIDERQEDEPAAAEPRSVDMEPQPVEAEPPQPIEMEPRPVELEPVPVDMEPLPVEMESLPVEAEPFVDAAAPPLETPAPVEAVVEAGPSAEERKAAEEARWASMAEEIRMQVLQRIDLFTDTGLRDQLGARLQPIVDRASADLVATINQHVGELLRGYVSEAIEREIENWKRNSENF